MLAFFLGNLLYTPQRRANTIETTETTMERDRFAPHPYQLHLRGTICCTSHSVI